MIERKLKTLKKFTIPIQNLIPTSKYDSKFQSFSDFAPGLRLKNSDVKFSLVACTRTPRQTRSDRSSPNSVLLKNFWILFFIV